MTLHDFEARLVSLDYHLAKGRILPDEPLYAIAVFRPGEHVRSVVLLDDDDLPRLMHRVVAELMIMGEIA